MAKLNINVSIPAGATAHVLTEWNFEIPTRPGRIQLLQWAPAAGLQATLTSLDTTIFQQSPVSGGAPAGKIPSELDISPIIERVPGGQKLDLAIFNPTAGAIVYLATIDYEAGGGRR